MLSPSVFALVIDVNSGMVEEGFIYEILYSGNLVYLSEMIDGHME